MDVALKVTDQPQESAFFDLVSGDNVLSIPLFQRPYRWSQRNLDWLMDDIRDIRSGLAKSVFLGVVVCVSRGASPGRPIPWEIVDGQQRLSTLYLLLLAAADVAARRGAVQWASGVLGTYLLVRPLAENPVNTKLVPSFADRRQFKKIWDDLLEIKALAEDPAIKANPPKPPAAAGEEKGALSKQYLRIRRALTKILNEEGQEALEDVVSAAANKLSLVSISLRDPIVAPKIFERLNNRAELVTVADLVRNEVFSRAALDASEAQRVFTHDWEPFAQRFAAVDQGLEKFLFPYGLIQKPTVTKSDLFSHLRAHWGQFTSPQAIIADMDRYTGVFLALEGNTPIPTLAADLRVGLDRIRRLGKPSSTYAFLLRLVHGVQVGEVLSETAVQILRLLEDFLFRRAICGVEPTGLHAVFKGLWAELTSGEVPPGVSAGSVRAAISRRTTVDWPNNSEFEVAIRTGNLYSRKVCAFAIREFELSRHGESPEDTFEIEHILPQTSTEEWARLFGDRYEGVVNTWANLVPLTGRMNPAVGNGPYLAKRVEYENSIFASTRELAAQFKDWDPNALDKRASEIVGWALKRWPTTREAL
jgi:hypothetical protein